MADVYYGCFWGFLCVIVLQHELFLPTAQAELHPALDFGRHTLIKPRIYHGREKRQISTTREENGKHAEHLSISYEDEGKNYILDLELNKELIPKGYFTRYQKNGENVVEKPNEQDHCHYQGKVRDAPDSWVALSTCNENGLTGVVFDGTEMHYLQKASNENDKDLKNVHFLYKHSDLVDNNKTCGYGHDHINNFSKPHDHNRILRYKRSSRQREKVRGPYNANRQSRYVELVLVVDNAEFKEMGENLSKVDLHVKNIANIINALYAPLNIFIALVGIVIWTERDEVSFSSNGDTTLTNFLHYRREHLIKDHPNDNAQLLTKYTFEHGVVGKALKGPICTVEYSGGVNTDHSPVVGLVATTVAHEMGHNFGMEHDTNECNCQEERCIMAPSSSSTPPTHWSSCSLEYLALAFEHGMDYCLRNKPDFLLDNPSCGNGFVEHGEQCDCGLPNRCDNPCCNATTCRLYTNATCATGECCDLTQCRPKNAGTVCRSAEYECDLPEYCTGTSEYCPSDIYKMDTELCEGGKAFCYQGFCRTRSDQCKLLWGETGKSSEEECYSLNIKGTRHGNCGYNKLNQSFFKCKNEDVLCGMLHCKHLNERLEFGMESVAILSQSFINIEGQIVPCRTALVDLGINQIDPGMSPDGAKCGDAKMCVNQKCMPVAQLRAAGSSCPNNCSGNGICNSLGHCHCDAGFAPPLCEYPGFGGSEDSGPTTDPNEGREFVTAMFIIFLGIIPALAIFGLILYYTRHNLKITWPQTTRKKTPRRSATQYQQPPPPPKPDDNHSLLQNEKIDLGFRKEFFGSFNGFSITPLKQEPEVSRPAPPVPTPPQMTLPRTASNATSKIVLNRPIVRAQTLKPTSTLEEKSPVPPELPPLNPGSNARPIISSPILENSTCTAKELISPLKHAGKVPLRPAPTLPPNDQRPLSTPTAMTVTIVTPPVEQEKKLGKESTLNRIASFLKKNQPTAMQNFKVNKSIDKNALRTIEISNPILQAEIPVPTAAIPVDPSEKKAVVMRAQSVRDSVVTPRPSIPNFGSMRNPHGLKRPVSIPAANRPKSPPPPRPPIIAMPTAVKVPPLKGYQKPPGPLDTKQQQNQYDDCLNESSLSKIKEEKDSSPISDNIYAVIDETLANAVIEPAKQQHMGGSTESVNLLGEIVSEIQNRNVNSIYSTSTLARKKKAEEELKAKQKEKTDEDLYVNTSSLYKVPENYDNVYSNMNNFKSSASSTSSGYINPSAVNMIPKVEKETKPDTKVSPTQNKSLSTFKSDKKDASKPAVAPQKVAPVVKMSRSITPTKITGESPTSSGPPKTTKPLSRQTTPPNLRSRKASPTRTAPPTPKNNLKIPKPTSNSPDLVTSCSTNNSEINAKSPDVLIGNVLAKKPNLPKSVPKLNKSGLKHPISKSDIKPLVAAKVVKMNSDAGAKTVTAPASKNVTRQNSAVAALQQKFENKLPLSVGKPVAAKNA